MKTLINYIKIMKYGLQVKMMLGMTVFFFAMGIVFELTGSFVDSDSNLGGLYLMLSGLYVYQLCFTPAVSKMVKSSPMKRDLITKAPVLITLVSVLFTFSVYVLLHVFYTINVRGAGMSENEIALEYMIIPQTAILLFVLFIYFGISFRFYVVGTIIMVVMLIPLMFVMMLNRLGDIKLSIYTSLVGNFGATAGHGIIIAFSYLMIFISALGCYLLNLALYRREISEITYRYALKQAAKA